MRLMIVLCGVFSAVLALVVPGHSKVVFSVLVSFEISARLLMAVTVVVWALAVICLAAFRRYRGIAYLVVAGGVALSTLIAMFQNTDEADLLWAGGGVNVQLLVAIMAGIVAGCVGVVRTDFSWSERLAVGGVGTVSEQRDSGAEFGEGTVDTLSALHGTTGLSSDSALASEVIARILRRPKTAPTDGERFFAAVSGKVWPQAGFQKPSFTNWYATDRGLYEVTFIRTFLSFRPKRVRRLNLDDVDIHYEDHRLIVPSAFAWSLHFPEELESERRAVTFRDNVRGLLNADKTSVPPARARSDRTAPAKQRARQLASKQTPAKPNRFESAVSQTSSGWYEDPTERFELRYFDGASWTGAVQRAGKAFDDPV